MLERHVHSTGQSYGFKMRFTDNVLSNTETGLILGLRPANEGRRYFETMSLIGWMQAYNQPCWKQASMWLCHKERLYRGAAVVEHRFLCGTLKTNKNIKIKWAGELKWFIVRRAGLLWSQQDFEWRWSVPLFKCLTVLEFSFILFDLCLLITFFNFIMNYVPIVTFWIFTYHKIWILSIMFCFIWSYWIIYFLACLEVSWRVVS